MSSKQLFANNAKSTLSGAITDVATALAVQAGHGARFPNPSGGDWFLATLVDSSGNIEIVKVTARSTDTFTTIVRAQEGTTAIAFAGSSKCELRWTKGSAERVPQTAGLTNATIPYADASGNLIDSPITVSGTSATLTGNLSVTGNASLGNVTISGVSTHTGNASFGNVSLTGSASITGNATAGNLTTAGALTAGSAAITGNISGGNITLTGAASVTGNVTGGNLTTAGVVTGASGSFTGNLSGGNISTGGTLSVTGALTVNTTKFAVNAVNGTIGIGIAASAARTIRIQAENTGSARTFSLINGPGTEVMFGATANAAATAGASGAEATFFLEKITSTNRSLNLGGSINVNGADYAEYERKALGCGVIAKGQIIGFDKDGLLTDRWIDAVSFGVKSTDPGYIGGDGHGPKAAERPEAPELVLLDAPTDDADLPAWEADCSARRVAHMADYASWELKHERFVAAIDAARAPLDRVAYAGKAPVNALGAQPGDFIVAVRNGDGIAGWVMTTKEMKADMSKMTECVGRVRRILPDGRAEVVVKQP